MVAIPSKNRGVFLRLLRLIVMMKLVLSRNPLKKSGCFPTRPIPSHIDFELSVAIPSKNRGVFLRFYLKGRLPDFQVAIPSKNRGVFLLEAFSVLPLWLQLVAIPSKNRGVFLQWKRYRYTKTL